jgi:hypothetical protein
MPIDILFGFIIYLKVRENAAWFIGDQHEINVLAGANRIISGSIAGGYIFRILTWIHSWIYGITVMGLEWVNVPALRV